MVEYVGEEAREFGDVEEMLRLLSLEWRETMFCGVAGRGGL